MTELNRDKKAIILHKGVVLDNLLFESVLAARNHIRFRNPARKFKVNGDIFTCANYGTQFKVIELNEI